MSGGAAVVTRPYIGLRYFEEHDAHLFYGRDEHVTELLAKVAENRFVAVMGSSGCGKSSLVRAGLLPELRSGMIPKAGPRWKVVEFRPGNAPLRELAKAIRAELGVEQAQALVEEGPLGIAHAVAEAKLAEGTNVLVIADQFEEVFRYQREESTQGRGIEAAEQCHALTRRLLDAAAQPDLPIYVLLVMRSDYLGECAQFPDLPERMSESLYLVPRLRRDQMQEAITAPLGGEIEQSVVQRLLRESGSDPDQLPRLQHLLGRMWDRAAGGRITMRHYSEAGGWEKGLEQHLEEVYDRLSTSQKTACARVFQQLSELDKGRAVRRRAEVTELLEVCGPESSEVVARFRAEGFLVPRENPVDITHECILREWPRLKEWLDGENRSARRLRELADAAKDAGWRPNLSADGQESIRGLAGLTLQNLSGWRDEVQPTSAWASRYMTAAEFETANGYLKWSETRDQEQKRRARQRTRLLVGFSSFLLCALLLAGSLYYHAELSRAREMAAEEKKLSATQIDLLATKKSKVEIESLNAKLSASLKDEEVARREAEASSTRAVAAEATAHRSAAEAIRQKGVAEANAAEAIRQKGVAEANAAEATRQRDLAEANAEEARRADKKAAVAEQDAQASKARELAALSTKSLNDDPELSVLLAMQAVNATVRFGQPPVPAAQEALRTALSSQLLMILGGHSGISYGVSYDPVGKRLATAGEKTAKVWDAESGKELLTLGGHEENVYRIAYSPDGKRLATASYDKTAKVWDAESGKELLTLRGHSGAVYGVAYSPDGKRLATASDDKTAKVWDAESGRELLTLRGHSKEVLDVAYSPDGKRLATASRDKTARVWDAVTGQELLTLRGHTDQLLGVAYSPNGKRLATAGSDSTAKVWDAVSGQELLTLRGSFGSMEDIAYSPDGRRLATISIDGTANVWDSESGQGMLTLRGNERNVWGVAYSPDGKRLATTGVDGRVRVWDVAGGEEVLHLDLPKLLELAHKRVTRNLTPDECQRYFQSPTCPPLP